MWQWTKTRAKSRNVPFTVSVADIRAAWPTDGKCPIFNIPLSTGKGKPHDFSPTLDRLNDAWGYEPGNIAIISLRANRAKGRLKASELEQLAAWMRRHGLE